MASIKFTIPYPPSINHYYGQRGIRRFIKKDGIAFRGAVANILENSGIKLGTAKRVKLTLEVYPPDRRKRDLDNIQKATLDALEHGGLFLNDSQVDTLITKRMEPTPPGGIDVTMEEI